MPAGIHKGIFYNKFEQTYFGLHAEGGGLKTFP